MNAYVVIMAGGSGERFWPYSRQQRPKQLLKLTSTTRTMIEEAIDRVAPIVPPERVFIITSAVLRQAIVEALPALPATNVIAEPAKRNTAPCLALAAAHILHREGGLDATMAVLTADHFIGDVESFRANITTALRAAVERSTLVTLGIEPTRPETGYGYIEMGDRFGDVVAVQRFREKPDMATALEYVRSGRYLWNSGMFFWKVSSLVNAMQTHLADVGQAIEPMKMAIDNGDSETLATVFSTLPDISIDYGVMERSHAVDVVPATFPWDDVGSWDALDRLQGCDEQSNVTIGDVTVVDTADSIVVNVGTHQQVATAVGVSNIVIVVTDDAVMVCDKSRAQDVKSIVASLRKSGKTNVL
jgi:mannose-1-phosphate guanylyltransferase